jgi:hypothetical protein
VLLVVRLEREDAKPAGAVLRLLRRVLRQRIAALDDAHRDDAVKHRAVVGALRGERDEMPHVIRRRIREQVENNRPHARLEDGLLVLDVGGRLRVGERDQQEERR